MRNEDLENFLIELEKGMSAQVWYANLSNGPKRKLINALRLAGFGYDDMIELLDDIGDQVREYANLYHVCMMAELRGQIVHPDQLIPEADGR